MGVLISDLTAAGTLDGGDLVELLADPGGVPSSRKVTLDELGAQAHRLGVRTVSTGTATITAADAGLPVYFSTTCTVTLNDIADGTKVMLIPAGGNLTLVAGSGVSSVVPATVVPQYNTVWAVKYGTAWLIVPNFKLANALGDVLWNVDPAGNGSTKRADLTVDGATYQFTSTAATFPGTFSASNFGDGTWTPTGTAVTNVSAITAFECSYARDGDVVFVAGYIQVTPTASGAWRIRFDVPIASDFVNNRGGSGVGVTRTYDASYIWADATNDELELFGNAPSTAVQTIHFNAQYRVL